MSMTNMALWFVFKTLLVFLIVIGIFYLIECYREKVDLIETEKNLLREKWIQARENRILWKEEHYDFFDFYNLRYQELYNIEIGAEDFYILRTGRDVPSTSWSDYCFEKLQFDREIT